MSPKFITHIPTSLHLESYHIKERHCNLVFFSKLAFHGQIGFANQRCNRPSSCHHFKCSALRHNNRRLCVPPMQSINFERTLSLQGKLTAQGKLLQQDTLWVMEQAGGSLARGRERHIFLFEQIVIFSETLERRRGPYAPPTYAFKSSIKVFRGLTVGNPGKLCIWRAILRNLTALLLGIFSRTFQGSGLPFLPPFYFLLNSQSLSSGSPRSFLG